MDESERRVAIAIHQKTNPGMDFNAIGSAAQHGLVRAAAAGAALALGITEDEARKRLVEAAAR